MTPSNESNVPPAKRRKLDTATPDEAGSFNAISTSLSRPVSPPVTRRRSPVPNSASLLAPTPTWGFDDVPKQTSTPLPPQPPPSPKVANHSAVSSSEISRRGNKIAVAGGKIKYLTSPFQLTKIRDLAPHQNVDTIELKDILGDPMIRECWNFNFLFELDFVM